MKSPDEIINDLRNGRRVEYRTISYVMMPPERHLAVLVDHAFAGEVIDCIEQLVSRLAQAERERDAAVKDLAVIKFCALCEEDKNTQEYGSDRCHSCVNKSNWKWRGVCAENTEGA